MGSFPTLAELETLAAEHDLLKSMFQRHQEALVGMHFVNALGDLEDFSRRLRRHMRVEETVMLPAYQGLNHTPRAGKAEFFQQEHIKIEQELEAVLQAMRTMTPGPSANKAVVSLLEREIRFKNLLEHHEIREEEFLFPRLRAALKNPPNGAAQD